MADEAPPIGAVPEYLFLEERCRMLLGAIGRHLESPAKTRRWVEELSRNLVRLNVLPRVHPDLMRQRAVSFSWKAAWAQLEKAGPRGARLLIPTPYGDALFEWKRLAPNDPADLGVYPVFVGFEA